MDAPRNSLDSGSWRMLASQWDLQIKGLLTFSGLLDPPLYFYTLTYPRAAVRKPRDCGLTSVIMYTTHTCAGGTHTHRTALAC